jgi:hypothetical protein
VQLDNAATSPTATTPRAINRFIVRSFSNQLWDT